MNRKKTWKYYVGNGVIGLYLCVALTSSWLSQSYPILFKKDGKWQSALFKKSNYTFEDVETFILPIIPFGPQQTHIKEAYKPPLTISQSMPSYKHVLGTDKLGRDVLSGIIHGARISLWIGFLSVFWAMLLGVPLGIFASFWGDKGIRFNILQWIFFLFCSFIIVFYMIFQWSQLSFLEILIYFLISVIILYFFIGGLGKIKTKHKIPFPLDTLVIKISEFRKSFPGLFLLLALTTLFGSRSIYNIVIIIVLLSWMEYARYARSESLSVIYSPFIESSRLLGFSDIYIVIRHVLPCILPTLLVLGSYGVSQAILLESALSFLGIGLPTEVITWGKMLADGRSIQHPWLVVFPGLAIFILIWVLNSFSEVKR